MGRLRRKPGMVDILRKAPDIVIVHEDGFSGQGRWRERFPVPGPLQVELGTGKGRFLQQMAERYPQRCFIGMEKEPGILLQAVRKTREMGLNNLKYILGDVQFLPQLFAPAEIETLYIHFCDPWPKSRHQKRRLTHEDFLRLYKTLLTPTGVLRFKTDNRPLFDFSLESFAAAKMELIRVSFDFHADSKEMPDSLATMTEYEAKFVDAGLPIHYCEARFGKLLEEAPHCVC